MAEPILLTGTSFDSIQDASFGLEEIGYTGFEQDSFPFSGDGRFFIAVPLLEARETLDRLQHYFPDARPLLLVQSLPSYLEEYNDRKDFGLAEQYAKEQEALGNIRQLATGVLDVSRIESETVKEWAKKEAGNVPLTIRFKSFGYRYGVPLDADFVLDCRIATNPYWDEDLRKYNGLEEPIISFFQGKPETETIFANFESLLDKWLGIFSSPRRNEVVIACGCTGGQHRSVYFATRLFNTFSSKYPSSISHREEFRWKKATE